MPLKREQKDEKQTYSGNTKQENNELIQIEVIKQFNSREDQGIISLQNSKTDQKNNRKAIIKDKSTPEIDDQKVDLDPYGVEKSSSKKYPIKKAINFPSNFPAILRESSNSKERKLSETRKLSEGKPPTIRI